MRFKRNLVLSIMSLMLVFGCVVAYAGDLFDEDKKQIEKGATLFSHSFIVESGWGKHRGAGTGTLAGDLKATAGNYIVEVYFGDYDPDEYPDYREYIGPSYGVYMAKKDKHAKFDCVATDIYNTSWDMLVHSYID
ncbi:MAG: hypothetical protein J6B96_00355 [Agathobacter sp.]|nr:hypothetical protein [Agathobacter sp.]MBP3338959.1 hypothetical protein [Lachnospiraceae bacterium]